MLLPISSAILTALGDILIGIAVLRVHTTLSKERKIDDLVVEEVKDERLIVILGIMSISAGLLLDVVFIYYYL